MAALTPAHALAVARWQWVRLSQRRWAAPAALLAALTLATVAAVAHWRAGQRLETSLTDVTAVAAQARTQPALPTGVGSRAALRAFIESLPATDAPPEVVQGLFDLAAQQGLRLARGSYRLQPEPAAAFARYRMTLPVQGEPAAVERFVQDALLAWPSLAVESIQFKRAPGGGRVLEARIQWVLFVRFQAEGRAPGAAS